MQRISIALGALVSREQDHLQCAPKDTCLQPVHAVRQAVNSRRSDPRHRRPVSADGRTPDTEGPYPLTKCATSIPQDDQTVQVG